MADLQIRRTTVTERSETEAKVEIWIADDEDPTAATETISLAVEVEYREHPQLRELQVIALERAQTAIGRQLRERPRGQ